MVTRTPATSGGSVLPGLAFRTYAGPVDIPVLTAIQRAAHLFDDTELIPSEERVANEMAPGDGFAPASAVFLAELAGRAVACGEVHYVRRDAIDTYHLSG